MATSFQPENQHAETKTAQSWGGLIATAVGCALAVVMLMAILAPRLFASEAVNWGATLGAGAVTLLVVLGIGAALRSRKRQDVS